MLKHWYSPAFAISVLLHTAALLLLILSFEFSSQMPVLENVNNNSNIISAVAVTIPTKRPQPAPPPVAKAPSVPKPTPVDPPKPEPAPVPPKVVKADELQADVKKAEQAIALKKPAKDQKALIQKQLLADLQKQKVKLKKETKKDKQKALEHAMEAEIKQQAEKSLQQQVLREERAAASAKAQGVVNKYKALILQAISERWLVPPGVNKKLSSELLIRLAPGGVVLDVQITKSSGDVALDRSARDAVFKASPLPVPEDANTFDPFRQFVLKVKPENIENADA